MFICITSLHTLPTENSNSFMNFSSGIHVRYLTYNAHCFSSCHCTCAYCNHRIGTLLPLFITWLNAATVCFNGWRDAFYISTCAVSDTSPFLFYFHSSFYVWPMQALMKECTHTHVYTRTHTHTQII